MKHRDIAKEGPCWNHVIEQHLVGFPAIRAGIFTSKSCSTFFIQKYFFYEWKGNIWCWGSVFILFPIFGWQERVRFYWLAWHLLDSLRHQMIRGSGILCLFVSCTALVAYCKRSIFWAIYQTPYVLLKPVCLHRMHNNRVHKNSW